MKKSKILNMDKMRKGMKYDEEKKTTFKTVQSLNDIYT